MIRPLLLLALLLSGCAAASNSTLEYALGVVHDDPARVIPLGEVHAFVPVEPMQDVRRTFPADLRRLSEERGQPIVDRDVLNELYKTPGPAPNLYLVSGDSISQAVRRTWQAVGGWSVGEPVRLYPDRMDESLWLVVHLGLGSGTPQMHVTEVTVEPGSIIARHERLRSGGGTTDDQHYIYWVPLGKVEDGPCRLTLVDMDTDLASLHRRVWIPEAERE